jgi:predicted aspartyl protease
VSIPFVLAQNHIHFPVSVNGNPPSNFLLDTGADASVIDRAHAEDLKLAMKGSVEARGAGAQSVETALIAAPHIAFSGIDLPLDELAAFPLGALSLREGRAMHGILGYDVLSRFAVTIDYEHRQLRFSDPSTFTPPAGASVLPLHFNGNLPIVHASATMPDGRSFDVRMLIDTGARQALVLNRPFLEKNHLFDAVPNAIEGPLGAGVGGATSQKIGRVRSLELAGFVIDAPVTSFATSTAGADADPDVDGLIGGEILRRFTVVIDYSHDRFFLARNAAFDEPFEYDMSGMLLVAADAQMNRFVVKSVLPSSPAAEAGVVANDELQSIDDRPASESNLNDIRAQFMRAGTYRLTLIRDGKPMNVTLTTRRLV